MIKVGIPTKVKWVKHARTKSGEPMTSFSVSCKVKDSNPTSYAYFSCLVFAELDIQDGDSVVVNSISSIGVSEWNGKQRTTLVMDVAAVARTEQTFRQEDDRPPWEQ